MCSRFQLRNRVGVVRLRRKTRGSQEAAPENRIVYLKGRNYLAARRFLFTCSQLITLKKALE
jgi:hypothetical protein